jgi:hypothetical protein
VMACGTEQNMVKATCEPGAIFENWRRYADAVKAKQDCPAYCRGC